MAVEPGEAKRPQFGGRVLGDGDDVFKHNAWDNVQWDEQQELEAEAAVKLAASTLVTEEAAQDYEAKADEYWDTFYGIHQNRFFKDRNWLFTEFPDLAPKYRGAPVRVFKDKDSEEEKKDDDSTEKLAEDLEVLDLGQVKSMRAQEKWFGEQSTFRVLEVGCGTGSTVYPILEVNTDPGLMVYCCDLSKTAVNLVKEHKEFSQQRCYSFVCDVTKDWTEAPFQPESLDIVTLIFVLSAIHPDKMRDVAKQIFRYMKPGGQVFFRDYGRYDMAQLRFKKGRCIQENFYVRGDGTRCYFFTQEEINDIFTSRGFIQTQNIVDRRLQVNRGKKLKMYRVWIQAKFTKPLSS